jgi:SAM-dependent methyltransferase
MATEPSPTAATPRPLGELFLVSLLILFLELACIRWFPAHVLFLTFFTNVVLLACFLGMSVGCLAAGHRRRYLVWTPLLLAGAVLAAYLVEGLVRLGADKYVQVANQGRQLVFFGTEYFDDVAKFRVPIEVIGGFFFLLIALVFVGPGQELGRALARVPNRVQAYTVNILGSIVGIAFFAVLSYLQCSPMVWFIPVVLGLAYLLLAGPDRLTWPQAIPQLLLLALVWLGVGYLVGPYVLEDRDVPVPPWAVGAAEAIGLTKPAAEGKGGVVDFLWSPYYRIDYQHRNGMISVNLIGHQAMRRADYVSPEYALPHLLHRDAQRQTDREPRPFGDVLIIGAGSGNDVSRAIEWGADHVDAVEIDPVILGIGQRDHPLHPYQQTDKVTTYLDDGRNFLRKLPPEKKYDLVVYALVDSLVLHSSYSNIRLESYLFTKQAFDDIGKHLKPDGTFVSYNYFRQGWIVARLKQGLEESFGPDNAVVFTYGYQPAVEPDQPFGGFTVVFAGPGTALLKEAFGVTPDRPRGTRLYWLPEKPLHAGRLPDGADVTPNGFTPPTEVAQMSPDKAEGWNAFGPAEVFRPADGLRTATDDWPFLYLRAPMVPELSLRGMAVMGSLALALITLFRPREGETPERTLAITLATLLLAAAALAFVWLDVALPGFGLVWGALAIDLAWLAGLLYFNRGTAAGGQGGLNVRLFLLGAGFMLIETKAVINMALLFGSTWIVNSVVFFAVLVMILLANLYVLYVKPEKLWPYYVGLLATLALNCVVPLGFFLGMPDVVQVVGSCLLVFAPILFAGVIFAVSFRRTREPDRAFGVNIAGSMLGGLAENTSMLLGFQYLLLVAIAFYGMSALVGGGADAGKGAKG